MSPHLNAIGTAVPDNDVHDAFLHIVPDFLDDAKDRRLFDRMAARSGIEHRFSTLTAAVGRHGYDVAGFYRRGRFPSTGERMARFATDSLPLVDAALADLASTAGPDWAGGVTHLLLTTCTGFAAPWLDTHLIDRHGVRSTAERLQIGFMGCNAALNAFKAAGHIVRSEPAARVLVLNLELCTLHLQEAPTLHAALTFMLFGDGAAASIVSAEPTGLRLDGFASDIAPASRDKITWRIGDDGFDMWLSGEVPQIIAGTAAHHLRRRHRVDLAAVDLWAVHPGGRTILDAVERGCALSPDDLTDSRGVLRDYGNMSSSTIPFVLARQMKRARPGQAGLSIGFGPGLSIESMAFTAADR